MCAIAGIAEPAASTTVFAEQVRAMLDAQSHRGPDGSAIRCLRAAGSTVVLGHQRLAILDLSEAGRQPMTSRDGRYTITLNGEIFNYQELRSRLRGPFRTSTDTEVFLEACAAWGVDRALGESTGMFAVAVWDQQDGTLTLARDRQGEKPLVYCQRGTTLAFASEMKALDPFHNHRLDPLAVDAYLALGYVPAPLSIFRNCRKLPAGHVLEWKPQSGIHVRRWWFPEIRPELGDVSREARRAALREHLGEAVRLRLRSDVPVAICLSGGVDSAAVAAECVRQGSRLRAFTIRFDRGAHELDPHGADTQGLDTRESADVTRARETASRLGLDHEVLELTASGAAQQADSMVRCYDEPFADSSALPSLALARALGGHYKVVLNGDGGDEAFGGYRHYERIELKQTVKAMAAAVGLRDGWGSGRAGIYVQSKALFRAEQRARLLNGNGAGNALDLLLTSSYYSSPGVGASTGALQRALTIDRNLHLANGLTYKSDIAFGSFGIEGRSPFLDHRLMTWAQSLPSSDLVRGTQKKVLLREAYRDELTLAVRHGVKQGFGAPLERWLRADLRDWVASHLPSPLLESPKKDEWTGQRLWTLAVFAAWAREWKASW